VGEKMDDVKAIIVKICPKCGSTKINNIGMPNSVVVFDGVQSVCTSCGFQSGIFPEVNVDEIDEARKEFQAVKADEDMLSKEQNASFGIDNGSKNFNSSKKNTLPTKKYFLYGGVVILIISILQLIFIPGIFIDFVIIFPFL